MLHLHKPYTGKWTACETPDERPETTLMLREATCPRCIFEGDPVERTRKLTVEQAHAEALAEDATRTPNAPQFPEGTPEYEAYRAELAVELGKFARGEDPYPYEFGTSSLGRTGGGKNYPTAFMAAEHEYHYGYSPNRSGYTPCGKRADEVTVTWYLACVTCTVCRDESTTATSPEGRTYRERNLTDVSAPEDPYDHDAWSLYLRHTTTTPDRETLIAAALEFGNPYAKARARAVEGYRRAARILWSYRHAYGRDEHVEHECRTTMCVYRSTIEIRDRLAREWAERLIDAGEAVTVR